jgi:hypothetical protein
VRERVAAGEPDPEISGKSMAVASKILAARWAVLPMAEKTVFEQKAKDMKAEAAASKAAGGGRRPALPSGWRSSRDVVSGAVVYTCIATKKSQWERPAEQDAVAMPTAPPSARRLYDMHRAANRPAGLPKWTDVSPEDRKPFEVAAVEARAEYNAKIKALR